MMRSLNRSTAANGGADLPRPKHTSVRASTRPAVPIDLSTRSSSEYATQSNSSDSSGEASPSSETPSGTTTPPSSEDSSSRAASKERSHKRRSLYNGPQLAEPCVTDALLHVLRPCGHKVITGEPEVCANNCLGSATDFANERTAERYICAVCISKYVKDQYEAKKTTFISSLDRLEQSIGGFKPGWKEERLARMEQTWRNEAIEELLELQKLGRRCDAISVDEDFNFAVVAKLATDSHDQAVVETADRAPCPEATKDQRPKARATTPAKSSRLPMPASKAKRNDPISATKSSSKLPVYRRK